MCLGRAFVEEMLTEEEQGTRGPRSSSPGCEGRRHARSRGAAAGQGRAGQPPLQVRSPPPITPPRSCLARFLFFPCELMTFPSCAWWPEHGRPFAVNVFNLLPSRWYFLPDCVSLIFPICFSISLNFTCSERNAGCCFVICPSKEQADKVVNACHNKHPRSGVCEHSSQVPSCQLFVI